MTQSLYRGVYLGLLADIQNGTYKPGARLPTDTELSERLGVSLVTVRHAMRLLAGDGLIQRWPRRGTFVTANLVERIGGGWSGYAADIERDRRFLEVVTLPVTEAAPGEWGYEVLRDGTRTSPVSRIRRVHVVRGVPMMCSDHFLPFTLTDEDVTGVANEVFFWAYLVTNHLMFPVKSRTELKAVAADAAMGMTLEVEEGTPLLHHRKVFYDGEGSPCECLSTYTRTEQWTYRVDATLPKL